MNFTERKHRSYRDRFTAVWLCGTSCNFKCEYCYPCQGKITNFRVDDMINGLKKLPSPFRIVITGGEPLLFDWVPELCQKIGSINGIIELQTNFSVNVREFLDSVSPEYVVLLETSFHPIARQKFNNNGVQKFIEDFKYAQSKGYNITTWLIAYPKYTEEEFASQVKILNDVEIIPMRKRYCGDEHGGGTGDAIWVPGKRCLAGYRSINIWEDFSVTPCDHDRTDLGNLLTEVKLYDEIKTCQKPFCGCLGRELLVDKFYDEYYKKEFGEEWPIK